MLPFFVSGKPKKAQNTHKNTPSQSYQGFQRVYRNTHAHTKTRHPSHTKAFSVCTGTHTQVSRLSVCVCLGVFVFSDTHTTTRAITGFSLICVCFVPFSTSGDWAVVRWAFPSSARLAAAVTYRKLFDTQQRPLSHGCV